MFLLKSENSESTWRAQANNTIAGFVAPSPLRTLFVIFVLILSFYTLNAQNRNSIYDDDDWVTYLNSRIVTSVSDGSDYVYFGTTNGIIRYNKFGNRWGTPINKSNGLSDNLVTAIGEDKNNGILWAATTKGLSRIEVPFLNVTNISIGQLNMFDRELIISIGVKENSLWLETNSGFIEADRIVGYYKNRTFTPPSRIKWYGRGAPSPTNNALFFMNDGFEYYGDNRLGRIIDEHLREYEVTVATIDDLGNYYSGTCGSGAFIGNSHVRTLNSSNIGILNNYVTAIEMDDDGDLWIGGFKNIAPQSGLNRLGYANCLEQYGLSVWNIENNEWRYFEDFTGIGVLSFDVITMKTVDKNIWMGTDEGLIYYENENDEWHTITAFDGLRVSRINTLEYYDSLLWVGSDRGIQTIDPITFKVSTPAFFDNSNLVVNKLTKIENELWVGTNAGAYRINSKEKVITRFNSFGDVILPQSSGGGVVTHIADGGDIILMSDFEGITQINKINGEAKRIPPHASLFRGEVRKIDVMGKYIWVATSLGLLRYNRENSSWRNYTTADGLSHNSVNAFYINEDYIWIGTDYGLTQFKWYEPGRADN